MDFNYGGGMKELMDVVSLLLVSSSLCFTVILGLKLWKEDVVNKALRIKFTFGCFLTAFLFFIFFIGFGPGKPVQDAYSNIGVKQAMEEVVIEVLTDEEIRKEAYDSKPETLKVQDEEADVDDIIEKILKRQQAYEQTME
jgi:hypothetical protein